MTGGASSLTIAWNAPGQTGGSVITAYDLRYIETSEDETVDSNWTVVEDVWTTGGGALEYTLTGLTVDTDYDLQVRAVNANGDGPWSSTAGTSDCSNGTAVTDPDNNPGLVSDCAVLLAARDTLAGTATLNWAADTPMSEWDGVSYQRIRPEGTPERVTELLLNSRSLTGRIPTELGNLSNLTGLSLSSNQLMGEIPTELGNLSNLRYLILDRNQLTGEIPAELGNLSNLSGLFLFSNQLTGEIPTELGNLSNLTGLYLDDNQLTGEIPTELGNLSNLQRLNLHDNQLTGELPQSLTGLTVLSTLSFNNNAGLCAPIDEAFQIWLQSVTYVSGSSCAPMDSAEDRAVLVELYNATDGANWTNNTNWLSDRPIREWHGVINDADGRVSKLLLGSNEMAGEIPTELGNLSSLTELLLFSNQLTGEIPTELGNLSNLSGLYLDDNQLTGELPQTLTGLTALASFTFDNNAGLCAPTDEAFQTWLQSVSFVSGDNCVAEDEDSAEDRAVLVELYNATDGANWADNTNWLSDEPMREWHGVTTDDEGRVAVLFLSSNQLTGEIPRELGNLSSLTQLSLSINQLTGEIPTELGNLSSLTRLSLSINQLTGEIPTELGNLSSLTRLSLSSNQLTGEIPTELGNLSNLRTLILSGNQLSGEIPTELGNLSNLSGLFLNHNQLTGEIPTELGSLSNLTTLSLNDNRLTGEIPTELGDLSNLTHLFLDSNRLTGEIPAELGNLTGLTILHLANNQFTGCMQDELRHFSTILTNDLDMLGLAFCTDLPGSPMIDEVTSGTGAMAGTLLVKWSAPASEGISAITTYDLRYIETTADETEDSNWTVVEDVWTTDSGDLEYTLAGFMRSTQYDVQVRAVNEAGGRAMVGNRHRNANDERLRLRWGGGRCDEHRADLRLRGAAGGARHLGRDSDAELGDGYVHHAVGRRRARRDAPASDSA